jgi:hypothetical protein
MIYLIFVYISQKTVRDIQFHVSVLEYQPFFSMALFYGFYTESTAKDGGVMYYSRASDSIWI